MASEATHLLSVYLRQLSSAARADGLSDRELVERFAARRDEDAFAALVRRHGPMVLRVCQRVLHDSHDAEDVFQATFLVLSRKAASLSGAEAVGCFLHGVAYRLALKARTQRARQRLHESRAAIEPHSDDPLAELSVREAQAIVDEELALLPEKYRAPLLLCCLQGRTRDEAARQLGWSVKLVKSRLEQGRERLRSRLSRRGLTVPAALAATLLAEEAAPAALLPATLLRATVQAVLAESGKGVAPSVAMLAESALGGMASVKAKAVVGLLLLTAALAAGVGVVAPQQAAQKTETPAAAKAPETPKAEEQHPTRTDHYGDPLPPGAVARIGTVRFREGDAIFALAYSPDGKMLASGTGHRQIVIRLWDTATGKQLFLVKSNLGQIYSLAFSPDGKLLASVGTGPIYVWDVASRKLLHTFPDRQSLVYMVAFSPDSRHLAVGGRDYTVRLWDLNSGKESLQFKGHQGIIWSFAFSADGKMLATGSDDKTVRLWDAATGKELHRLAHPKLTSPYVAFSPNNKVVAGGNQDGSVHLWDTMTGREQLTIPGHDKWRNPNGFSREGPAHVVFSPDGKYLAAGNEGVVYDAATGKERCQLQGFHRWIRSLVFSPDGKTLAGESAHRIRFWDAATGKEIFKDAAHREPISSVAFSPDGKLLFSASMDDSIGMWDAGTGRERFRFQGQRRSEFEWHLNKIALAPDGKTAAAWLAGVLYSWDVRKPKVVREYSEATGLDSRHGLTFSPQGHLLTAGFSDKDFRFRLWTKGTARDPILLNHHKSVPNSLIFSADGETLASAGSDGAARLWDVATGKELHTLPGVKGHPGPKGAFSSAAASSLAFSSDGKTLAVGGSDGSIGLWDKTSGRKLADIVSSPDGNLVQVLAFSPDGKTLAAGHEDGTVHFWESATGKIRREWATQTGSLLALAFSPDGRLLASAGSDTTVLIWNADADTQTRDLNAKDLETLWATLAGDDASKAYQAIGALRPSSRQTVPFVKTRLRPVPEIEAKRLARLIADLDEAQFAVREKASVELTKYGDRAEPSLRKTLATKPNLEVRRRIETILEALNRPLSGEQLRAMRAVEVLERIGTLPAQEVLRTLAAGAPGARLTREAQAALERLTQH